MQARAAAVRKLKMLSGGVSTLMGNSVVRGLYRNMIRNCRQCILRSSKLDRSLRPEVAGSGMQRGRCQCPLR
eukprot:3932785-Pleurochrysis_carterae.AAC.2